LIIKILENFLFDSYLFDSHFSKTEHSEIYPRSEKKKSWTSKLTYDAMNNWILKENFENGKPYSIEKREIIYYK